MQLAVPESPAKEACHPSDRWILEAPGDLPAVAAAVPAAAELAFVAIETAATANVGVCNHKHKHCQEMRSTWTKVSKP